MNIDFHHGVTYVTARFAGFSHNEAKTVAYASQYVADATNSGIIKFDNGSMYNRISSSHKMLDYRNFSALANHQLWIPFHFLPGNGGLPAGENPEGTFIDKLSCFPDSPIILDMVSTCINGRHRPYALHRLGITLHTLADSWAHQNFVGVPSKLNNVQLFCSEKDDIGKSWNPSIKDYFGDIYDHISGKLIGDVLGHAAVLSNPDKPYLRWKYKDFEGKIVERDNPPIFLDAANSMCKTMQQFILGKVDTEVSGLTDNQLDLLQGVMLEEQDSDSNRRHERWLQLISQGYFGFPPIDIEYYGKGRMSWKHKALGTLKTNDLKSDIFKYDPAFLTSNWKYFHDALMVHRMEIIINILPKYGICVA